MSIEGGVVTLITGVEFYRLRRKRWPVHYRAYLDNRRNEAALAA